MFKEIYDSLNKSNKELLLLQLSKTKLSYIQSYMNDSFPVPFYNRRLFKKREDRESISTTDEDSRKSSHSGSFSFGSSKDIFSFSQNEEINSNNHDEESSMVDSEPQTKTSFELSKENEKEIFMEN